MGERAARAGRLGRQTDSRDRRVGGGAGASGARWFVGDGRGAREHRDERPGQLTGGTRRDGVPNLGLRQGHGMAARRADAAGVDLVARRLRAIGACAVRHGVMGLRAIHAVVGGLRVVMAHALV